MMNLVAIPHNHKFVSSTMLPIKKKIEENEYFGRVHEKYFIIRHSSLGSGEATKYWKKYLPKSTFSPCMITVNLIADGSCVDNVIFASFHLTVRSFLPYLMKFDVLQK